MKRNYLHFTFEIDEAEIDLLQERCYFEGFKHIYFQHDTNNTWTVHVYVRKGEKIPAFLANRSLKFVEIENAQHWTKRWSDGLKPFDIIKGIKVIPLQKPRKIGSKKKIGIIPGLSFGTGLHETTKICAEFIGEYLKKNDSFLDIGTGTGILSVLAMKLGAGCALAVDNDENSLSKCRETASINNVDINITYSDFLSGVEKNKTYDFIVSNMIADPLLSYYKDVSEVMTEKSTFVISGILKSQQKKFMVKSTPYRIIKIKEKGEWIGFALKRK